MTDRTASLLRLSALFDSIVRDSLIDYRISEDKCMFVAHKIWAKWDQRKLSGWTVGALMDSLAKRFEAVDLLLYPY